MTRRTTFQCRARGISIIAASALALTGSLNSAQALLQGGDARTAVLAVTVAQASHEARSLGQSVEVAELTDAHHRVTADPDGAFTATVTMPSINIGNEPSPAPANQHAASWMTVIKGAQTSTPDRPGTSNNKEALRVGTCPKVIHLPGGQLVDGNCGVVTTARTYLKFPITVLSRPGLPEPTIFDDATITVTQTRASYCNDHGVTLYSSTPFNGSEVWPGPAIGAALQTVSSRGGCTSSTPGENVTYSTNIYRHLRNLAHTKASAAAFALRSTVEGNEQGWRRFDASSPMLRYRFAYPPSIAQRLTITPSKVCGGVHYLPAVPEGQTHHVKAHATDINRLNVGLRYSIRNSLGQGIKSSPLTWVSSGEAFDWPININLTEGHRYTITATTQGVRTSQRDPNNPVYLTPSEKPATILVESNTVPPAHPVTVTSDAFPVIDGPEPVPGADRSFTLKSDPADQIVGYAYSWRVNTVSVPHNADCNLHEIFPPTGQGLATGGIIPATNGTATLPFPTGETSGTLTPGVEKLYVRGFDAAGQTTNTTIYTFKIPMH